MKKKLINFDVFKKMNEESLSAAERELTEAEDILARTLDVDDLKLNSFTESTALYETLDGTFVHLAYKAGKDRLFFEGIEELIIEEESEQSHSKELLSQMVDNILDNNNQKASQLLGEYLKMPMNRNGFMYGSNNLTEAKDQKVKVGSVGEITVSKPTKAKKKRGKRDRGAVEKADATKRRNKAKQGKSAGLTALIDRKKTDAEKRFGIQKNGDRKGRWRTYFRFNKPGKKKMMAECVNLTNNIYEYLDWREFGPTLRESEVKADERGNVTAVTIPNAHKRNENKILQFNWDVIEQGKVKKLRSKMKKFYLEDSEFAKAITALKRYNNISDNKSLQETLERIASSWPDILFLTQEELAESIDQTLEMASSRRNWGDQECMFMAEAILRTAHEAYTDRVNDVIKLSGLDLTNLDEQDDKYLVFKQVVDNYYPNIDEAENCELKIFSDLYEKLNEVYRGATDDEFKKDIAAYMSECESVLNREAFPDMELAEEITDTIKTFVEANVEMAQEDWGVNNDTYRTTAGEHPRMAQIATVPAIPGRHMGDWGGKLPVSDGKNYKGDLEDEMRNRAWGNESGGDIDPDLRNPYVPNPYGTWTMKGEKGADRDGDSDWSRYQSSDTWPKLQNPYVPKSETPKTYKMKSDNLIVDK